MIHVAQRLPPPDGFELAENDAFIELGLPDTKLAKSAARARRSHPSDVPGVVELLAETFHRKCAYCETPGDKSLGVDEFRPRSNARGHTETEDEWRYSRHYWWLAWEWRNLYAACVTCDRNKATWFPVSGERASESTPYDDLEELAFFLDPCVDDPEAFLDCDDKGVLMPLAGEEFAKDRARFTIDLIGLNRPELVSARKARISLLGEEVEKLTGHGLEAVVEVVSGLEVFVGDAAPYALACRSALARRTSAVYADARAEKQQKVNVEQQPAWAGYEQAAQPDAGRVTSYVQRVRIENFQPIKLVDLHLELAGPTVDGEDRVGWLVLLGENGSGKSSLLRAIGLGLMGEERANALRDPGEVKKLTRRGPDPGPLRVRLELSGPPFEIEYGVEDDRFDFDKGAEGVPTVVRGYGTSRLPPRGGNGEVATGDLVRLDNLFDAHATLIDAGSWLQHIADDRTFERAADALADLFQLEAGDVFRDAASAEVQVRRDDAVTPLSQLSDGYQALTGLVAELMAAFPPGVEDFREETGIVLLDELGVHLHPSWRMRVVGGLRRAFPKFQFLATTHEPLCLRGLDDGEVAVMRMWETGIAVLDDDVPPVRGLRIDQLLTSRHFGLNTTIDPDVDAAFERYYELLADEHADPAEIAELRDRIAQHRVLGYTRRDQLVYEFIDEFLSKEARMSAEDRARLRDETKDKVLAVWRRVGLEAGDAPGRP